MADEMKEKWESIEKELKAAMSRLSDAIEKAREEIPEAAKAINDEYLKMQEKLDKAVDKLRK
jgi:predicted  nucleic acid-binding Zn-ribbon protein